MLTVRQEVAPTATELASLRGQLLEQVRRNWIRGVLDRSLAQVARVELGLAEQPVAVANPWGALLVQPGQPDHTLPPGTPISAVAGRFDGQLLILGDPGAGKTTLLLEYARDLLEKAARDAASSIPVVFHLSAWPAEQPPLAAWLVEELALRYGVARRLAVELVKRDYLAVLLDGMDEVPQRRREACVEAINAFRGVHGGVGLVACARSREYKELTVRLVLKGAVAVQTLDRRQVSRWLAATGRPLAGLRAALREPDHWLWTLLDSPLMLSIAALTYKGRPATAIRSDGGVESLLDTYLETMLARPRAPLATPQDQVTYTDADTLRWLGWLAERMGEASRFYPDWMQTDWLPTRRQRWLATTGLGLASALVGGLAGGLAAGLITGLGGGLAGALVSGLAGGLGMGLTRHSSRIQPIEPIRWSWRTARTGLDVGLAMGLGAGVTAGLLIGIEGSLVDGLVRGLGMGLGMGLIIGSASSPTVGFESRPAVRPTLPLEGIHAAARIGRNIGLARGLVAGLGAGLAGGFAVGGDVGLAAALVAALGFGLAVGLDRGGASYFGHRLLVVLLRRERVIPADLIRFLDYADDRILLRRAGGGYLFIHRLLQDYFRNRAHQTESLQIAGTQHAGVQ